MPKNWTPEWKRAPYAPWLAPGAIEQVEAEYGKAGSGLDRGALREGPEGTEILWAEGQWIPFKTSLKHISAANAFARIGSGWSAGHNPETVHASGDDYFRRVHGREPNPVEAFDANWNEEIFRDLQRRVNAMDAPGGGDGGTEPNSQLDRIEAGQKEILTLLRQLAGKA